MSLALTSVPTLQDNYVWILNNSHHCIIVDPGEVAPVIRKIKATPWQPQAILLTHHHADHLAGVEEIRKIWPEITVYGPPETLDKGATRQVTPGETLLLSGYRFEVIATPGHTLGHVSYYSAPYLFCGDTLFSGGCGRLFEGSASQMYQSFEKLNQLPGETLICCAHEYTLSNLAFAKKLLPENRAISDYYRKIKRLRDNFQPSLPSVLSKEREINVFLKTQDDDIKQLFSKNSQLTTSELLFAELRRLKDRD